jgi:hypothetical protein
MASATCRVEKKPGFKKKPAQWVFLGFWGFFVCFFGFLGVFGFFLYIYLPRGERSF